MTQATILIVDDTPANLRLLSSILDSVGYKVRPARNGQIALTAAQSDPPDLILLDIMMPGMDGYEVCRHLKCNPKTEHIPVIFISALDDIQGKVKSFELGGVDYITKPFQSEEVLARVNSHITIHTLQKNLREQVQELDAFAHTVAHDLKNPLSYIVTMADFINTQFIEQVPAELVTLLQKMENSTHRGVNIIDELLLLSSVRKQDIELAPVDMGRIVRNAQDRINFMMTNYEGTITLQDKWPDALGYGPWIEEVWVNYLSNALKYGGRPPTVACGAAVHPTGMIRFWAKDNGDGLTPEKQAILFTEFVRLKQVRVEGYGLGLSIVQRIVNKLGGNVGVHSEIGQGSTFYFELPPAD